MKRAAMLSVLAAAGLLLSACAEDLALSHTETPCINAGQTATVTVTTAPGASMDWKVQDDFGGDISPPIASTTADSGGKSSVTWQSPKSLTTTTLHFIVDAKSGNKRAHRDIHVVVGGNGRSC